MRKTGKELRSEYSDASKKISSVYARIQKRAEELVKQQPEVKLADDCTIADYYETYELYLQANDRPDYDFTTTAFLRIIDAVEEYNRVNSPHVQTTMFPKDSEEEHARARIMELMRGLFILSNRDDYSDTSDKMKDQDKLMDEMRDIARKHSLLLGREIKFQTADSYAHYVITQVDENEVTVQWVNYCDGWQDDRLGVTGKLPREYVEGHIRHEDHIHQVFGKNYR